MLNKTDQREITLYRLVLVLVEHRRVIAICAILGLLAGALPPLLREPKYSASFLVIPAPNDQASDSRLRGVASTLGIRGLGTSPTSTTTFPPFLMRAARSREILEQVLLDTVVLPEIGRTSVLDLLVPHPRGAHEGAIERERRIRRGMRKLTKWIRTGQDKDVQSFSASVVTSWPVVSQGVAAGLLRELQALNTRIGQQSAALERRFVQQRIEEQTARLRAAQDRAARFLRANREFRNSPELTYEFERLEAQVSLHEQVMSQLTQSDEDAQLKEVRDTPVLTAIEYPRVPVEREPRGTVLWGLVGLMLGSGLGVLLSFIRWALARDASDDPDAARMSEMFAYTPWRRKVGVRDHA